MERKQIEDNVLLSQVWLRNLIKTTQDAILSIDLEGRIVLYNPAAERMFGYSREEIVGRKVNALMTEPYATEHDGYIERYERTGEPRAIGRIRTVTAKRKNGEIFPIELSVTEIAEDPNVRYAAFIRDISEKVQLQEQLVEEERLAAIGTTAAKIAHEIGNPLNGMSLTIQLLEQQLSREGPAHDSQISATVNRLKREVSRLKSLAEDFRFLSRRERFELIPVTLATLVEEAIEIDLPRLQELQIEVHRLFPPDLPAVVVDIEKMKQAILNLVKNAAEAMPGGGSLTFTASPCATGIMLEISDTGIGVPPDINIFDAFVTTKRLGTGLGLAIVLQIVKAHGGTIRYESARGKGTTFLITLPI